jgi:very-short-patch-repair endonuclease
MIAGMWKRQLISPTLRNLIRSQSGILTAAQASIAGLGPDAQARLVREGHWRRVAEGLFDASPLFVAREKDVWAALLHAGPSASLGGEQALLVAGLARNPGPIEVWVPSDRVPTRLRGAVFRRDFLGRIGRAGGRPSRISGEDAVLDVGQRLGTTGLIALLSDALRCQLVSPESLAVALAERRRVRGRARFVSVLSDLEGIESILELQYCRDVELAHGLPKARRQVSVSPGTRSDGLYEEFGVLVEVDGRQGHWTAGDAFRDLDRDNRHVVTGLATLRYGSADIRGRPCEVAAQVAAALRARGWTGSLRPCPRCRRTLTG